VQGEIVEMKLPNGSTALARVASVSGGATKTSNLSAFDFEDVGKTLEGLAETLKTALKKAAPNKVTVELGLELAVKNGKLSGLLVEGEGKGSLAVTLEWSDGVA
jgi:NTP-dependent ternary system trypsin peptidase co-occuring protein